MNMDAHDSPTRRALDTMGPCVVLHCFSSASRLRSYRRLIDELTVYDAIVPGG